MIRISKIYSDEYQKRIKIVDCREQLVNVRDYCRNIAIKKESPIKRMKSVLVRKTISDMLNKANSLLPKGYKLAIADGYRSIESQKKLFDEFCLELKKKHPSWKDRIKKEASKFVSPIDVVPPHTTGGAVDVTILDKNGEELDMGSVFGELNIRSYTDYDKISNIVKKNRKLLIKAMTKAGFVNYPREWWHWSYGDKCWAAVKRTDSIYRTVKFKEIDKMIKNNK